MFLPQESFFRGFGYAVYYEDNRHTLILMIYCFYISMLLQPRAEVMLLCEGGLNMGISPTERDQYGHRFTATAGGDLPKWMDYQKVSHL